MKIPILILLGVSALIIAAHQVISMEDKKDIMEPSMKTQPTQTRSAVFAGGCFWCTESDFEHVDGVLEVISGYTGGHVPNPTYKQVSAGITGHVEAVKVIYDPTRITYAQLLDVFWRHVNPTDAGGQFVDRGRQYRSVIFYADEKEKALAEQSKQKLAQSGPFSAPIVTDILPLGEFYEAEAYHQDYYEKNPIRYRWYRGGSGRDDFLEKTWAAVQNRMKEDQMAGTHQISANAPAETNELSSSVGAVKAMPSPGDNGTAFKRPSDEELRRILTPLQYDVTQKEGTEPAFNNEYWDNHEPGIYVDIVSGEPLFSSTDKFDSGTGWPSFTQPLEPGNIVEKTDRRWLMTRTEVRSKQADSHLGHLFDDGPAPTGLRYCMNSAALRFIPKSELKTHGLERYLNLFE